MVRLFPSNRSAGHTCPVDKNCSAAASRSRGVMSSYPGICRRQMLSEIRDDVDSMEAGLARAAATL